MTIAPPLTANDLAISEAMNRELMTDTCVKMAATDSTTLDSYGQPTITYPDGATFVGFLELLSASEQLPVGTNGVVLAGRLWFPLSVTLTAADKVKVTARYGRAITPMVFECVGDARPGITEQQIDLRRVTL